MLYYAGIEIEYDAPNEISDGFGDISSDTTEVLSLNGSTHTTPYPQTDGWRIEGLGIKDQGLRIRVRAEGIGQRA